MCEKCCSSCFKQLMSGSEVEYISNPLLKLQEDPNLHICSLSHVELDNEGCRRLFTWLRTGIDLEKEKLGTDELNVNGSNNENVSYSRRISYLELNDVQMTDIGFQYLIEWLNSLRIVDGAAEATLTNVELKTVILRANMIEGTSESAESFVAALPRTLTTLVLSNNPLSSPFRQTLLGSLSKLTHLRRLLMPMTRMDTADSIILSSYIGGKSPRCSLVEINVSGNSLKFEGIKMMINAIQLCWSLQKVELFGNYVSAGDYSDLSLQDDDITINNVMADLSMSEAEVYRLARGSGTGVSLIDRKLMFLLARNIYLSKEVEKDALILLKYSRLMLHSSIVQPGSSSTPQAQVKAQCNNCECMSAAVPAPVSQNTQISKPQISHFSSIPVEIQLDILSHLAPHLSFRQRIRIFEYATDKSTLPRLQLCLPTFKSDLSNAKSCIIDPSSLPSSFAKIATGISQSGTKIGSLPPNHLHARSTCAGGQCLGSHSVVCQKQIEKKRWLELVGCESYDMGE